MFLLKKKEKNSDEFNILIDSKYNSIFFLSNWKIDSFFEISK